VASAKPGGDQHQLGITPTADRSLGIGLSAPSDTVFICLAPHFIWTGRQVWPDIKHMRDGDAAVFPLASVCWPYVGW